MRLSQSHDIWMTGSEMSYDDFVTPCGYLGRYGCAWAASSGGAGTRPVTNGYPIKADIGHPGPDSLTLSNGVDARGRGTARASSFRELGLPSRGRRRRDALPATAGRRWSDGRWQSSQAGLLEHQSGPTLAYGDAEKSRRSALGGLVKLLAPRLDASLLGSVPWSVGLLRCRRACAIPRREHSESWWAPLLCRPQMFPPHCRRSNDAVPIVARDPVVATADGRRLC